MSLNDLNKLLNCQSYSGQLFSCSALSYADELLLTLLRLATIGMQGIGFVPNGWDKYAVHVIEPILQFLSEDVVLLMYLMEAGSKKLLSMYYFLLVLILGNNLWRLYCTHNAQSCWLFWLY